MSRFLAGFATASVLWAGAGWLYLSGVVAPEEPEAVEVAVAPDAGVAEPEDRPRRRGRRRRGGGGAEEAVPTGTATTGDDLGADDPRALDMAAGGEEQLPRSEVEAAMNDAFGRIRRCLVLAAGDDPVTGRLVFGLRIEPSGQVSRVNLRGPAAVTTGDAGDCLRQAARGVSFRSFDGPPMIVHYPITLE